MKTGDIVKFVDRYEKQKGRTFLVLGRYRVGNTAGEFDHSKWAKWAIIDMMNGSVYTQIGRDLEVLPEVIEHEIEVMALALAE